MRRRRTAPSGCWMAWWCRRAARTARAFCGSSAKTRRCARAEGDEGMLRNYLSAALGNLGRNWLYAGITVLGLAVSFAAAILIGLYLRDEYSFDRFIPDYQRIYRVETELNLPGAKPMWMGSTVSTVAGLLKLDFPEIEHAARFEAMTGVI